MSEEFERKKKEISYFSTLFQKWDAKFTGLEENKWEWKEEFWQLNLQKNGFPKQMPIYKKWS